MTKVFGGLYQETYKCGCGKVEKHAFSKLPDIMQTPIHGNSTQTCIDALFSYEEVHKICPNCKSSKSLKSSEITLPPTTLILQLLRFSYDASKKKTRKLHTPISCTPTITLRNCGMYQLNSVINHIGETSTSGHYNILLNDSVNKRFILVDDTNVDYNAKLDIVKEVCYIVAYTKI